MGLRGLSSSSWVWVHTFVYRTHNLVMPGPVRFAIVTPHIHHTALGAGPVGRSETRGAKVVPLDAVLLLDERHLTEEGAKVDGALFV